jgi:hypothetical protein
MSYKIYRVKIEGWVVQNDFGGAGPELTPADWGLEAIVSGMGSDVQVTETLVDTIEEE